MPTVMRTFAEFDRDLIEIFGYSALAWRQTAMLIACSICLASIASLFIQSDTYLLLIRFLTDLLDRLFTTKYQYQPFGKVPWICLNPAANHYRQPVITNLKI
jgi:hypothetical protein